MTAVAVVAECRCECGCVWFMPQAAIAREDRTECPSCQVGQWDLLRQMLPVGAACVTCGQTVELFCRECR